MKRFRLNLSALRSNQLPQSHRRRDIDDLVEEHGRMALSRRQMLLVTGGATVAAAPSVGTVRGLLAGSFEVIADKRRVALCLGGKERWAIDARRFAGAPKLSVERTNRVIRIELSDARYPGTMLPADLVCEIRPGLLRRTMDLSMTLGGFHASMPLEPWLLGAAPAQARVMLDHHDCRFDSSALLHINGDAVARFTPDWCLDLDGDAVAALDGFGQRAHADRVQIALPADDVPSLLEGSVRNGAVRGRTLISLERGTRAWGLDPGARDFGAWTFAAPGDAFDSVRAEFTESRGRTRSAMVAEGIAPGARLSARPHTDFRDETSGTFGILLRNARYAVAFAGGERHAAVMARYAPERTWLHAAGVSVLLGDDDEEHLFELGGRDGAVEHQVAAPAIHATYVPLAGAAVARPVTAPKGTRLAILDRAQTDIIGGHPNHIAFNPNAPDEPPAMLLSNAAAAIVRPEDLVVLIFQFEGMNVAADAKGGFKGANIVRTDSHARIIVWFQPQNISEEAFFETAEGYPVATGNADDPDKSNDGKDGTSGVPAPYAPPVKSRMAGLSRVVFNVPSSVSSIPCTLEDLLVACGAYDMNVAPHALPPKESNWYLVAQPMYTINGASKYIGNSFRMQSDASKGLAIGTGGVSRAAVTKMSRAQKMVINARATSIDKTLQLSDSKLTYSDAALDKAISSVYGVAVVRPPLRAPLLNETSIETPYRLYVSPNSLGAWAHAAKPVYGARTGRVELWHTRLGVRQGKGVDEIEARTRTLRAIWSPDIDPSNPVSVPLHSNSPFRMTLDSFDRVNIVNLSANFNITKPATFGGARSWYTPLPIAVDRFMLSSLGAWMNTHAAWPRETLPSGFSVEEWRHRGTMGRDHYVRVVYAGFMYPFGHYASLIKVTERKLQPHPGNPSVKVAYLRQRMFIVVREPEKNFRASGLVMKDTTSGIDGVNIDLQMPFASVRITTLVTPNLDPPELSDYLGRKQSAFWPRVNNEDFLFHVVMKDVGGNSIESTVPMIFVGKEENDRAWATTIIDDIGVEYEKPANENRRKRPINGQKVAFTESVKPGDTQFETDTVTFGVQTPQGTMYDNIQPVYPRYYPVVRQSQIRLAVAKHLTGNNAPTKVEFADVFLKNGYTGGNPGQVFLKMLAGEKVSFDFNTKGDKSGGLVKPNMDITALSRMAGPISGANAVEKFGASGKFNPEDFFKGFGGIPAKLFGVIDLWDLLDEIGLDNADLIPKFVTEALDVVEGFLQDVEMFLGYVSEVVKAGGTIATVVNNLKSDIDGPSGILAATDDLTKLPAAIDKFITDLNALPGGYISIPTVASMQESVRREAEKMLNRFRELINTGADFITAVQNFAKAIEMVKEMKIKFEWKPKLNDWGFSPGHPLFIANNKGTPAYFLISVEARAKTDGKSEASFDVVCGLENFTLDLIAPLSFIKLYFNKVVFVAAAGKKPEVDVDLAGIEFVGVLSFVEALRSLIPLDGFSDPPGIDVTAEGIKAHYSVSLPNIAFGVFSLQNITLGAGFCIPFIGQPLSVNFNFCTRENPFLLTVSMIGGGGYFGITLDPGGVQLLEVAFEFGASLALDFGVASGEVHIMAGIYFKMEGKDCTLTGYLRIGGSVDVLGLITASIELRMELSYEFASGKCVGRATLTVEVEVLFFSASVEISCERKFAGSNGDPSFRQLMEAESDWHPWDEYCEAFA